MHSDMYFHGKLIKDIVTAKNAKVVLELGVRSVEDRKQATSTYIFHHVLSNLPADRRKLYSCDIIRPVKNKDLIRQLEESKIWHFFEGDDRSEVGFIKRTLERKSEKIDILFIDTHKNYKLTKFELENYSKLLSDTGVILMHDLGVNFKYNSVKDLYKSVNLNNVRDWQGHDMAIMEFLESTDFKLKAQLGSYNMGVLFRDRGHLSGVKVTNDLNYDHCRNLVSHQFCKARRNEWNAKWKMFEKER
mgnify:CR=1 FL=1